MRNWKSENGKQSPDGAKRHERQQHQRIHARLPTRYARG
jgi:hypothetical protein